MYYVLEQSYDTIGGYGPVRYVATFGTKSGAKNAIKSRLNNNKRYGLGTYKYIITKLVEEVK